MTPADDTIAIPVEASLPPFSFSRLALGVDNLRYDVFLSPRWRQLARQYLYEQILHHAQPYLVGLQPGDHRRRSTAASEFKTATRQTLREALHRAKAEENIEIKALARLAMIKWLLEEGQRQFTSLAISCKEKVEKHGSLMPDGMERFVLRSKVEEFQSNKRHILNAVGENLFQLFEEFEQHSLQPARTALFGNPFADIFGVLRSRLIYLDNPNDSITNLENYVMLGHFRGDPDHEDRVTWIVVDVLREATAEQSSAAELADVEEKRQEAVRQLHEVTRRLRGSGQGRGKKESSSRLGWLKGLTRWGSAPGEANSSESDVAGLEAQRQRWAATVEELDGKVAFLRQQDEEQMAETLSNPTNAQRLFGSLSATGTPEPLTAAQQALLRRLRSDLDQAGILQYILASYYLKLIYKEFCPPLNPQQLKHAVASRGGWREFDKILDQYPSYDLPVEKLEDLARRLRRLSRGDTEAILLRFIRDFMRLRRAKFYHAHLTALLEKINLVTDENTRHVSRLNRSLYEFLLPDEVETQEEEILSHVVIKADVRDSTGITEELLRRGLNPATHLSYNFYEPVRKLIARYSANKIFIEGDALILGLFETQGNRGGLRPVAKACLLAKEIIEVCQVYNQRAGQNDLPVLELGLGIAFHCAPPHYWEDGESRIMISSALNNSDRLASCARAARRLVRGGDSRFRVFQFQRDQGARETGEEEEQMIRYNVMGVALNQEGFQKLQEEIALTPIRMSSDLLGQRESITLYGGTVPLGSSFEKLIIREARVPRLLFPGAVLQEWTPEVYYEVCVDPRIYEEPATPV